MRLLGILRLEIFVQKHERARAPIGVWRLEAQDATWAGPEELQSRYLDAVVEPGRAIFSISKIYKLDVKTEFKAGVLVVERVWTTKVEPIAQKTARSKA